MKAFLLLLIFHGQQIDLGLYQDIEHCVQKAEALYNALEFEGPHKDVRCIPVNLQRHGLDIFQEVKE